MKRLRHNDGFTIPELLVGIALAAVAGIVIFNVFISTQSTYQTSRDVTTNQAELRLVMGMIAQEIRSAGSDVSEAGIVDRLSLATDTQFSIESDLNSDQVLDAFNEPAEQVSYLYDEDDETLARITGAGVTVLLRDVTALQIIYLDANSTAIAPPLDAANRDLVRAIQLTVTVEHDDDEVERTWTTLAAIRNDPSGI